jgi:acyl-CoA reductase-like NAD-dependent aldehyde dehydrogenase
MASGSPVIQALRVCRRYDRPAVRRRLAADLDRGAVQVLAGLGLVLNSPPIGGVRMINYTVSTAGRRAVATAEIGRMIALQRGLSASNPVTIAQGTDLEVSATELARGMLILNGQWREAPRRVYVHMSLHDEPVPRLLDDSARRSIGDATSKRQGDVGPLANQGIATPMQWRSSARSGSLNGHIGGACERLLPRADDLWQGLCRRRSNARSSDR